MIIVKYDDHLKSVLMYYYSLQFIIKMIEINNHGFIESCTLKNKRVNQHLKGPRSDSVAFTLLSRWS